jgi:Mg-chelatase subunit ChlD
MRVRFSNSRSGIAVLLTAVLFVVLIPFVGLTIDVGVLYLIKTKLSAAVDSGAVAGARALNRGTNDSQQTSSAQATARSYAMANYPGHYIGASTLSIADPEVDMSVANRRSVRVTATVEAPLYFLRMLGTSSTTVRASAVATRRDVNIVVVLDRSGSLAASGSCEAVKMNAVNFVNRFAEGRDNVGLVTFASGSRDDFPIATNFKTATPNVEDIAESVKCAGATNSAQALWQGYVQLAKLNQPGALNVILFFTDGQPTAFTGNFKIAGTSTCTLRSLLRTTPRLPTIQPAAPTLRTS